MLNCFEEISKYRQTSNIKHTSEDNKIVDHSEVVGASPVGTAPTTSSFLRVQRGKGWLGEFYLTHWRLGKMNCNDGF